MKWIRVLLCASLLPFFGVANGQELKPKPMIVVIDPGHGGTDSGAVGIGGIREKDITLKIALEIVRTNRIVQDKKLEIYLTRYIDTLISLKDRTRLTRALKSDLFLSIHCNWSPNPHAHGVEAFVAYPKPAYKESSRKSIALALELVLSFERNWNRKNRGVKFAGFQVLQETIPYCLSD